MKPTIRPPQLLLLLAILTLLLSAFALTSGSVHIPLHGVIDVLLGNPVEKSSWQVIVLESRLPRAITALLAGAALSVAGLLLQTTFANPLAGPSILGLDAGASLAVGIVMLTVGGTVGGVLNTFSLSGHLAIMLAAFVGAATVLAIIIAFSTVVRSNTMLLIVGIMVGYIASSLISLISYVASSEGVFSYALWGMGNFTSVTRAQLPFYSLVTLVGLGVSITLIKPLNALLLGERYAQNLGVNVRTARLLLLLTTGLLTAVTTAYCGPISFLGLAVPHMARLILRSAHHAILLPATLILGALVAQICNIASTLPIFVSPLPLNAITPIIGAPIVIYVIVNQRKLEYFN